MAKLHWTQTPEGKRRMSEIQRQAHARIKEIRDSAAQTKVANAAKRFSQTRKINNIQESPTIVVQGWSITVVGNQLRIERES